MSVGALALGRELIGIGWNDVTVVPGRLDAILERQHHQALVTVTGFNEGKVRVVVSLDGPSAPVGFFVPSDDASGISSLLQHVTRVVMSNSTTKEAWCRLQVPEPVATP